MLEIQDEKRKKRARFKSSLDFVRMLDEYVYHLGDIRSKLSSQMLMWVEPPKTSVILKELNKMLTIKKPLALYKDFYRYINAPQMLVLPEKNMLEWDDVFPFLYLLAAFEGLDENRTVKHLVIDEMQDYTPIQYAALNMIYPCRKTILGDFGQVLNPCHLHTLDDLKALYEDAEYVTLNRSYRSTCEIMSYANAICQQPCLEMIERHGPVPQTVCCESDSAELEFLSQKICEFEAGSNASLGIVVKTNNDAEKLFDILSQSHNVNLLTADSTRFSSGVSVTSIQMAKGLEFDEVLVPGASNTKYDDDFDRHLLYIACTRAMHKLTISYAGEPSRFLK